MACRTTRKTGSLWIHVYPGALYLSNMNYAIFSLTLCELSVHPLRPVQGRWDGNDGGREGGRWKRERKRRRASESWSEPNPQWLSVTWEFIQNKEGKIICNTKIIENSWIYVPWRKCIYVHVTLSLCQILPFPLPISSSPFSSRSASLFPSCP